MGPFFDDSRGVDITDSSNVNRPACLQDMSDFIQASPTVISTQSIALNHIENGVFIIENIHHEPVRNLTVFGCILTL